MVKIKDIVCPHILTLKPYSSARDEFAGQRGIFLDANENPFGKFNRYPDPYQKILKQKLSEIKKLNTKNIFIGNGSDEIIDLAFRIFCDAKVDQALAFSPTYGMYRVSAQINRIELLELPLTKDFQIDTKAVKPYFSNKYLKLIFICSPNNPTGNLMNSEDIEYILKYFHGIVVLDEAYIDFAHQASLMSLIKKYNNLIVSQTFSKAWGLAGIRIGVAYANEEIIQYYNKIKPPYNISKINQDTTVKALENYDEFNENLKLIIQEKNYLREELGKINKIKKIYHSDANFLLIEILGADNIYKRLVLEGVIVRNRSTQIKNCLRISVGTRQENQILINSLKKVLAR